jgi:penicillin-binding protein 1A
MLNGALESGTGKRAAIPLHAAAGKTGTTQSFRDAWFVGYTAHLTTGVWTGNDDGSAMNRVVGGSLPAEIWRAIMARAHIGRRPLPLSGAEPPTATWVPQGPAYPQNRIGDDFIASALGDAARATGSIEQLIGR